MAIVEVSRMRSPSPKVREEAFDGECPSPVMNTAKQQRAWLKEATSPRRDSFSPQLMYPKKGLMRGDGSFTLLARRSGSPRIGRAPRPIAPRPMMPPKCGSSFMVEEQPPRPVMPPKCVSEDHRLSFSPPSVPRSFSTLVSANASHLVTGTRKLLQHNEEAARQAAAAKAYARRRAWEIANTREVDGQVTPVDEECEFSEPRADLEGLLEYLEMLKKAGARLTEVTYIVNSWTLAGLIPLRHHGFVVKADDFGWVTFDFSRRGILWDTFELYPDLPEGTIFAKKCHINVDPGVLLTYCKDTKPFSWLGNDCSHFAAGMMRVLRIVEDPFEEHGNGAGHCACANDRAGFLGCSGGTERPAVGCFS